MNDEFIITCSSDNTIKYWHISTNKCAKILYQFIEPILDICKLNKNEFISYEAKTNKIIIWNFKEGAAVAQIESEKEALLIRMNLYQNKLFRLTDESFLAARSGKIFIYNYQSLVKQLKCEYHKSNDHIHFINLERFAICKNSNITIYNYIKDEPEHTIATTCYILNVIKINDYQIAYAGCQSGVTIIDIEKNEIYYSFEHGQYIGVTQMSLLNGSMLVTSGFDGSIKTWDIYKLRSSNLFSYGLGLNSNILLS
jgi:WD40 repeat protein